MAWSARTGLPTGEVFPVAQMAALGRRWYRGRLAIDWRPRTLAESQAILASTGFAGAFWSLTG